MQNNNVKQLGKLESIIGKELFVEVVNEMPGVFFRLPNDAEHYDKQQRNEQIKSDYRAGMEIPDLIMKYGLKKSTIYRILETR